MSLFPELKPGEVEVWICARKRKCGWRGPKQDLVKVPDRKMGPGVTRGCCPKSLHTDFYVRTAPAPIQPHLDFQI